MEPDIDIIVVNYKTYPMVQRFIDSYRSFLPEVNSRLILVDNEFDRASVDSLDLDGVIAILQQENVGYAEACNSGAALGDSKYIAFMNSDTEFVNDTCVDICVQYLEDNPDVAVVGPLQYDQNGAVTHAGIFGTHDHPHMRGWKDRGDRERFRDTKDAVTVSGSAFFLRRSIWEEMQECSIYKESFPKATGAFPPFPHFYEETLYCYHVFAHGYRCVYLGEAELIHGWHKSSKVGSQTDNYNIGRKMFREFCDSHGVPHD